MKFSDAAGDKLFSYEKVNCFSVAEIEVYWSVY